MFMFSFQKTLLVDLTQKLFCVTWKVLIQGVIFEQRVRRRDFPVGVHFFQ